MTCFTCAAFGKFHVSIRVGDNALPRTDQKGSRDARGNKRRRPAGRVSYAEHASHAEAARCCFRLHEHLFEPDV